MLETCLERCGWHVACHPQRPIRVRRPIQPMRTANEIGSCPDDTLARRCCHLHHGAARRLTLKFQARPAALGEDVGAA
ncbi:MAG: hypothetical protein GW878_01755 [Acidobacteria bacterium]|nr:hypothetical protein [Acidobacteriota bacterium]